MMYYPLGLLGPVIIKAKIYMQKLWRLKIDWDESLPEDLHTKWKNYEHDLPCLREITVPRTIIKTNCSHIEIHGYSDASEIGYGAGIYLRCISSSNHPITQLLTAKSRLSCRCSRHISCPTSKLLAMFRTRSRSINSWKMR